MRLMRLLLAAVASALPVPRLLQSYTPSPAQGAEVKVLLPLYIYPSASGSECTQPEWLAVAAAGSSVVAIINPSNGPVTTDHHAYEAYAACMAHLKTSGVSMIGYVPTKIAHEASPGWWVQTALRPLAAVREMIDVWDRVFGGLLDGIFVDEVSNRWTVHQQEAWGDHLAFYLDIFSHIREAQPSWRVVANAGSAAPDAFYGAAGFSGQGADVIVHFEGSHGQWDPSATDASSSCREHLWTRSQGSFSPGPWCPYVPSWDGVDALCRAAQCDDCLDAELGALIYAAGSEGSLRADPSLTPHVWLNRVVEQAVQGGVTYLFVTDQPAAAPWSALPSYWTELVSLIAPSPSPSSPPSPPSGAPVSASALIGRHSSACGGGKANSGPKLNVSCAAR